MKLTAIIHDCSLEGETGFAATCAEIPEANGQGESVEECLSNLREAIVFVLESQKVDSLRNVTASQIEELEFA
ncbi:type II toxin-antitoxin system HicB family antitoxin [Oscillatoria amoena NRMC-F 0135]|nr:type II toxin-antitoxin system HicB family antitoxin [Oscillatoria amoena NRMC-F 0135]